MAEKNKRPEYRSERGRFAFPRLNAPDTKFKADGEYSVKLVVTADQKDKMVAQLQPHHDEAVKNGKTKYAELPPATKKKCEFKVNPFVSEELDKEGNETGNWVFNFKLPAKGEDKKTGKTWTNKPALFDAKGQPMKKAPAIWGGTEGKISFQVNEFFVAKIGCGISLRLKAAQIIKLVQGGNRDAESYGFGAEDDGYVYDESAEDDLSSGSNDAGTEGAGEGSADKSADETDF